MSGVLQAHQLAAPGPGISARAANGAERIIAAGHQHAAIRQRRIGHGSEVGQLGAALGIGRSHQQGAMNARCSGLAQMCGRNATQAVSHDDGRTLIGEQDFFQLPNPGIAVRHQPVLLLYTHCSLQLLGPQALPMTGAGVAPARHDHDAKWGCHAASCNLGATAKPGEKARRAPDLITRQSLWAGPAQIPTNVLLLPYGQKLMQRRGRCSLLRGRDAAAASPRREGNTACTMPRGGAHCGSNCTRVPWVNSS